MEYFKHFKYQIFFFRVHDFITLSSTKALFAVHKYFKETFSVTCSYSQKIYLSRFTRLFLKVKQKQFPQHAMHSFFIISIFMWKEKNVLQINLECGQHCSIDKVLHTIQKMCSQPGLRLRLAGDCEDDRWGSTSQNRKTAILLLGQNNLERRHLSGTLLGSLRDEWEARHSLKDCNSTNMTVEIHRYISKIK